MLCTITFFRNHLDDKKKLTLGQGIGKFVKNAFSSASERYNIKGKL